MGAVFFEELNLPAPTHSLEVGSGSHGLQTARIATGVEQFLETQGRGIVVVEGDTNTTLGAALAASRFPGIAVAHVEAGCRSFNRRMPEEINRIVVDHISDLLFAATPFDLENLSREGLSARARLVGSTGVEACLRNAPKAVKRSNVLERLGLQRNRYAVVTVHREENTSEPKRIRGIAEGLRKISARIPVVFPAHPRTVCVLQTLGIALHHEVLVTPPLGYFDFLALLSEATLVLTDSGGVQEEAAYLGTRCFTLREETEWTFTVDAGSNTLVGTDPGKIAEAVIDYLTIDGRPPPLAPRWPTGNAPSTAIVEELLTWQER